MRGEKQETPLRAPLLSQGYMRVTEGRAFFSRPGAFESKDVGTIVADEKGSYRARLHASGRDTAFDAVVKSPVERHLVQFSGRPRPVGRTEL